MDTDISITIVMPCLNEEKNIGSAINSVLNYLNKTKIDSELIIVNDGSTDNSINVINKYRNKKNVVIVSHKKNLGLGAAFKTALNYSTKSNIVLVPGDNENDIKEAIKFLHLMKYVDIVVPFIINKNVRSFFRKITSALYLFIINTTFFTKLNYTNGTIIYKTSVLKQNNNFSNGFFYNTEILIKLLKSGYIYAEIPSKLSVRNTGKSKALTIKSFLNLSKNYIKLVIDIYFKKHKKQIIQKSNTYKMLNG